MGGERGMVAQPDGEAMAAGLVGDAVVDELWAARSRAPAQSRDRAAGRRHRGTRRPTVAGWGARKISSGWAAVTIWTAVEATPSASATARERGGDRDDRPPRGRPRCDLRIRRGDLVAIGEVAVVAPDDQRGGPEPVTHRVRIVADHAGRERGVDQRMLEPPSGTAAEDPVDLPERGPRGLLITRRDPHGERGEHVASDHVGCDTGGSRSVSTICTASSAADDAPTTRITHAGSASCHRSDRAWTVPLSLLLGLRHLARARLLLEHPARELLQLGVDAELRHRGSGRGS